MAFDGILYDQMYREKPYAQEVDRIVPYLKGTSVLDIGGGTGNHSIILKQRGFEPHIIDISESMLEVAKKKGLDVERADIAHYASPTRYDSAIAMFHVLNFCSDLIGALRNIHTALKEGGTLVFDMWDSRVKKEGSAWLWDGMATRYSRKRWVGDEVFIVFFFPFRLHIERNHLYCPPPAEVNERLKEAGFTIKTTAEDGLNYFIVAEK